MEKTKFQYGHRWTMEELSTLMRLWQEDTSLRDIAIHFTTTTHAILRIIQRLRTNGVPLARRTRGHISGRSNKLWTQGEVEYLMRRRIEKATNEEISVELGRSEVAINGMIARLKTEDVPIAMRGKGTRKLWNADALKATATQMPEEKTI